MFIHHAESSECFSQSTCAAEVRGFQNFHMDTRGWNDIGYSFLVGGDGSVFEGRGWDKISEENYENQPTKISETFYPYTVKAYQAFISGDKGWLCLGYFIRTLL
ncbi:Peptidoglycan-recognition protein SC1a [Bulinus truncatus]|nr:Peptidoglycan-recognition protein SC1a [Bulinus truncatus]